MAIKRYGASKDTTIVNAYEPNLTTRGTGSNTGKADVGEVFSIYGRESSGSQELSRFLMQFPITQVSTDRSNDVIPVSGSVNFYLKVFNASHSKTVPENFSLVIHAVSQSWQEGVGLDLEGYKDLTKGASGANWMSASNTAYWTDINGTVLAGGSYHTGSTNADVDTEIHTFKQTFTTGLEDLEIDITPLVEQWIAGTYTNYGIGIKLSASYEAFESGSANNITSRTPGQLALDASDDTQSVIYNPSGSVTSYYTKRFFASGSQFFFSRPAIEARWSSVTKDDRGDFTYSSSLAPASENLNTLYLYNYIRGQLTNIPTIGTTGSIMVSLHSGNADNTSPTGSGLVLYDSTTSITGGYVSTGIYSCSIGLTGSNAAPAILFDVWHSGSQANQHTTATQYFTSSLSPSFVSASQRVDTPVYYMNITNLKNTYRGTETARFNLYVRSKFWNPTIYTIATTNAPTTTIHSASYKVYRVLDGLDAVKYNTGSDFGTGLSYDVSGNYFDFDMGLLDPGYAYAFKFAFYNAALNSWTEQPYAFKFRVEDYEY